MSDDERDSTRRDDVARRRLLGILAGSWTAAGLYALTELGVPEQLGDGSRTAGDLAARCGAHPAALGRLLRALSLMGLLRETEPGRFALTPTTSLLRGDVTGSVRPNVMVQGNEIFRSFADITHTIRTGEPAFNRAYGRGFYEYLTDHPDVADNFHRSMQGQRVPEAISTVDFTRSTVVVDVGGGNGYLLTHLLHAHPGLTGVLVELPEALRTAEDHITGEGLIDRVRLHPGSFFEAVPEDGDVYVLSRVLHNWSDEDAAIILRRVHAAMRPGSRLVVAEDLLPEAGDTGAQAAAAAAVDLLMLVTLTGRDRTETEYRDLLAAAGFTGIVTGRATGRAINGVLEAIRA